MCFKCACSNKEFDSVFNVLGQLEYGLILIYLLMVYYTVVKIRLCSTYTHTMLLGKCVLRIFYLLFALILAETVQRDSL